MDADHEQSHCASLAGMALNVHLGVFIGGVDFLGDFSNLGINLVVFFFFLSALILLLSNFLISLFSSITK